MRELDQPKAPGLIEKWSKASRIALFSALALGGTACDEPDPFDDDPTEMGDFGEEEMPEEGEEEGTTGETVEETGTEEEGTEETETGEEESESTDEDTGTTDEGAETMEEAMPELPGLGMETIGGDIITIGNDDQPYIGSGQEGFLSFNSAFGDHVKAYYIKNYDPELPIAEQEVVMIGEQDIIPGDMENPTLVEMPWTTPIGDGDPITLMIENKNQDGVLIKGTGFVIFLQKWDHQWNTMNPDGQEA